MHAQMAGNFEDGTRRSSVGLTSSAASMFTTPQVDSESATDESSGMKASLFSDSFGSFEFRLSARDFASMSLYCGELKTISMVKK